MKTFAPSDIYAVKAALPYGDPLSLRAIALVLGPQPTGLYLYLSALPKDRNRSFALTYEESGLQPLQFSSSLEDLELAGLVRVYKGPHVEQSDIYSLVLAVSQDLPSLLVDPLFLETAKRKGRLKALKPYFDLVKEKVMDHGYLEVTASYEEGEEELLTVPDSKKESPLFSRAAFRMRLEEDGIEFPLLSEKEIRRLEEKVVRLYPLSEESFADLVAKHLDKNAPLGSRVDFASLLEEAKAEASYSHLRKKEAPKNVPDILSKMKEMKAEQYLKSLQKGHKPAYSDLKLIQSLREMGLRDEEINALVYYTIYTKDGTLPTNYVEKVAATLVRLDVKGGDGVLDYLAEVAHRSKKKKGEKAVEVSYETAAPKTESKEEEEDEEEIDVSALIDSLGKKK